MSAPITCHACGAAHPARFAGVTYVPAAHVAPCGVACAGGVPPEERSDAMHGFGACPRLCLAARIERLARVAEDRGANGDPDGAEEARQEAGRLRLLADAAAAVEAVLPRHAAPCDYGPWTIAARRALAELCRHRSARGHRL